MAVDYDAILRANPVLSSPGFQQKLKRWEKLRDVGEAAGLRPYSPELAEFIAYGMTHGTEESVQVPLPRRRRGTRGLGALDANTLEQWNGKRFRMPDAFDGGAAIWYGADGPDGEHATVATFAGSVIVVEEYTYVVGLIEDPEQDYAVQSTRLDFADVEAAVHSVGGGGGFTTNLQVLRWAASIGVAKLAYWGGEEFWARALPRRVYDRTAE